MDILTICIQKAFVQEE